MKKRIFGLRYLEKIKSNKTHGRVGCIFIVGVTEKTKSKRTYVYDPPQTDYYTEHDVAGGDLGQEPQSA